MFIALLALTSYAQITSVSLVSYIYESTDTSCTGSIKSIESQIIEDMGSCESDDDNDPATYHTYQCDGNTATSIVTKIEYGTTPCTTEDSRTVYTPDSCMLDEGHYVKHYFNCETGAEHSYNADIPQPQLGLVQSFHLGTGCGGTSTSSGTSTAYYTDGYCQVDLETNTGSTITCTDDKLTMTQYTDTTCTTPAAGGVLQLKDECTDMTFVIPVSVRYDLIGCGASELSLFLALAVAFFMS